MEPYYLIAPVAIAVGIGWLLARRRPSTGGVGNQTLTAQWGHAFRLERGELLREVHLGRLYTGPAIRELHGAAEGRVCVGLTTHARLVVGRGGADDDKLAPHSAWIPGGPVVFANDIGIEPGRPPGSVVFVMFGTMPGDRLPVWLDERAAAMIAAWRNAAQAVPFLTPPN
jgi:hypothetical protein